MISPLATGISVGLGAAAGLGLVAGGYAYAARWPASRIFGSPLIAPRQPDQLALTFDDGPNPAWTPRLLDILADNDVHATFFLIGSHAHVEPALVNRIASAGHLIGLHSWGHPDLAFSSPSRVRSELNQGRKAIEQITGVPLRFFRPPFGSRNPFVLRVAREMGLVPVLWNAMTADWKMRSAENVARRLAGKIERLHHLGLAANVVLHDGCNSDMAAYRGTSIEAARLLIARYKASQRFVTLDAWA